MKQALAFLTPLGGAATPSPRALPWFPIVGALVGGAVGIMWWAAAQWWSLPVAAVLAIVADLVLTGMLHVDGLADSADGLLPPLSRERRLEVMKDPRAGAFGVVAVVTVLLLRFAVLASIAPTSTTALTIAGIWCASRGAMAVTACTVPYARGAGLATAFLGGNAVVIAAITVPLALAAGAAGTDPHVRGVLAVVGCGLGAALVVAFARAKLGGFTGDVLGAAGVVGETLALLILAVHA
jgi:adenosylcobinamide-GDP ribazoletransferase